MSVFVAVRGVDPLTVAVGRGRPGVAVKIDWVEAASSVWADAVYSPFKVAKVSGVAEFEGTLHANWTMLIKTIKRARADFLMDMGFLQNVGFQKLKTFLPWK